MSLSIPCDLKYEVRLGARQQDGSQDPFFYYKDWSSGQSRQRVASTGKMEKGDQLWEFADKFEVFGDRKIILIGVSHHPSPPIDPSDTSSF